jgi:hypothetical protein
MNDQDYELFLKVFPLGVDLGRMTPAERATWDHGNIMVDVQCKCGGRCSRSRTTRGYAEKYLTNSKGKIIYQCQPCLHRAPMKRMKEAALRSKWELEHPEEAAALAQQEAQESNGAERRGRKRMSVVNYQNKLAQQQARADAARDFAIGESQEPEITINLAVEIFDRAGRL